MFLALDNFNIQCEGKESQCPGMAESMNVQKANLYVKHKCASLLVCTCSQNIEDVYLSDTCSAQKFLMDLVNLHCCSRRPWNSNLHFFPWENDILQHRWQSLSFMFCPHCKCVGMPASPRFCFQLGTIQTCTSFTL